MNIMIETFLEYGLSGAMLGVTNLMFWKFLNKYIKQSEQQTKILAINTEILKNNTKALEDNKKVMDDVKVLLRNK